MKGRFLVGIVAAASIATGPATASGTSPEPEPFESGAWSGTRLRIIGGPDWLAADEQHVYVRRDDGHVDMLNPETGAITLTVDVGGDFCQGIGAGDVTIWTCSDRDVVSIHPGTGEFGSPIAVGKATEQGHLVVAFHRVWVLAGDGGTLIGLNSGTGTSEIELDLGARCLDVAADERSVWVSCALDDVVLRVDPVAAEVVDRVDIVEPRAVAFSPGAVWVGAASEVVRLDAETLDVVATIDGGAGRYGGIAADETAVWVRRAASPLVRIDTATNEVTDELDLGVGSGGDVLVAHGSVWTTAFDDAALFRIDLDSAG
jgi:outer membrane protein assembly factor BamB